MYIKHVYIFNLLNISKLSIHSNIKTKSTLKMVNKNLLCHIICVRQIQHMYVQCPTLDLYLILKLSYIK